MAVKTGQASAGAEATEGAAAGAMAEGTGAPQSARDRYRSRIAEDEPDLDMDDEEAYYTRANERYDDYKGMKSGLENLNSLVDRSPMFRDMIAAAKAGGEDFNPFAWAAKERGLDLQALAEDPEYADMFAESHAAHLKSEADGEKLKKEAGENYQKSIAAINDWAAQNGMGEEQKGQTLQKVYDMLDDANKGIISLDIFQMLANGASHDQDVEAARNEGKQEGLAANVTDRLRKMPKPERGRGAQRAERQPEAPAKNENPFLA